jgi:rod shape-determining protein MreC
MIDDYVVADNEIFAKVLIDKKSPFLKSIIINKGSRNNIKLGMAVLDGIYFIGKVVELNYSTSRILLISDINSKIPVSLEPIGVQAIMSGNGEMNGIIEYVNQSNLESENTNLTVFTSGMGGLFKSGIPIGRIIKEKNASNITSNVNFYKDLSQLKYVKILSYKKENLNLEIENSQDRNVEMLQETNNQNYLFKEQQKISNEIRVKLEEDKILLNKELTKLKKEISKLKKDVQNQIIEEEKNLIDADELKFLKLNFLYAKKCTKTFYNKLYKVGSTKYKKCILNKGKN